MQFEDIKLGMKVVPLSKTSQEGEDLVTRPPVESIVWRNALLRGETFLYVVAIDSRRKRVLCNARKCRGGDYFKAFDLEPAT